jgi:hypothetical protein
MCMQVKDGQGLRVCQGIGESPNADDAPLPAGLHHAGSGALRLRGGGLQWHVLSQRILSREGVRWRRNKG